MMDLAYWPATVVLGLLALVSTMVIAGALTRDRQSALAAMRLDAYRQALKAPKTSEPASRHWWNRRVQGR
jgi:hypothetical protein